MDITLTPQDAEALRFVADMYGIQLDQLAALLIDRGEPEDSAMLRAREAVTRWRDLGYAECAELSVGEPWVWATRATLDAFDLKSRLLKPGKTFLRHNRAVTEVRLMLERSSAWRDSGASWRSERQIRTAVGSQSRDEHLPDAEVRWPADSRSAQAGQIWAVEVEVSSKSLERTTKIMRQTLARTGEYGSLPETIAAPGQPPRYSAVVYLCGPTVVPIVLRSRAELGTALARRIVVHDLPESALRLNTPKRGW